LNTLKAGKPKLTWLTIPGVNLTGGTDEIRACDNPEDLFLSKTGVLKWKVHRLI
jgi:hypothetical protein